MAHAETEITGGRIEKLVGTVIHSPSMRQKGAARVQQGKAEKVAAGHLADADRLENAAAQKRRMAGIGGKVHNTAGNLRGNPSH